MTAARPALGRTHSDVALAAALGGAHVIQFRDKELSDPDFLAEARRIAEIARAAGVIFIVNDRVEAAKESRADGVHVGQSDRGCEAVRDAVGPDMIIGVSAANLAEARLAAAAGADYIGVGPIFATNSKADAAAPIGTRGLAAIAAEIERPIVAIGGIGRDLVKEIRAAGASGAAHIEAVAAAPYMAAAVRALRQEWET